jgi:hypothetical protein
MHYGNQIRIYTKLYTIDMDHKGWYFSIKLLRKRWVYIMKNDLGDIIVGEHLYGKQKLIYSNRKDYTNYQPLKGDD